MTLHIALLCGLTAIVSMALQVPLALLSCYLIFLMYRDNAGENILIGVGLILAATVICAISIVLMMIVADEPSLRLAMMGIVTFGAMWLARASKLGEPAGLLGFILVFILSAYDYIAMPELVLHALTWIWMVVFVPMVLLVALGVFAGRSPRRLVEEKLRDRLLESARLAEGGDPDAADGLVREGNEPGRKYVRMGRFLGQISARDHARLVAALSASYDLLVTAQAAAVAGRPEPELGPLLRGMAAGKRIALPSGGGPVSEAAHAYAENRGKSAERGQSKAQGKTAFLQPDAFENPVYTQFALKVLLAVFLTYVLYTSIGLFEIHTAMVTCFVVALGTAGETFHKSSLRIIGCLIGVGMGVFAVYFVVPHLSDSGHLFLLVATGSFLAGWVATGSYRVQYAGFQIALAFFICVLPGSPLNFGPNYDLADAGYRILGILVGIGVMGLVFSLIWPESAKDARDTELNAALEAMARVLRGEDRFESVHRRIGAAKHADEVMKFEWPAPAGEDARRSERRLAAAVHLARLLPFIKITDGEDLAPALVAAARHETARLDTGREPGDEVIGRARNLIVTLSREGMANETPA